MRTGLLLLAACSLLPGCQLHHSLNRNTVQVGGSLTDLNYQQVLDNVARFHANPASLPSVAIINAGTVTVGDEKGMSGNATYSPTLTFAQQGGGALPILSLLFGPSYTRSLTENWSLAPVVDVDNLRRIRCALQLLVGGETSDCYHCMDELREFYMGELDRLDCLIPTGWYHVGGKKDVPRDACYVGRYCDVYVWVMPDGVEGLTRFTMTFIDLATGKPHAPTRTVVRTYEGDKLTSTQVTTTEVDQDALKRLGDQPHPERPRRYIEPSHLNPGLFFVH